MNSLFPGSIKAIRPKMQDGHRGRTWDRCTVIATDGTERIGYYDTSWGMFVYFPVQSGWRKVSVGKLENYKVDLRLKEVEKRDDKY